MSKRFSLGNMDETEIELEIEGKKLKERTNNCRKAKITPMRRRDSLFKRFCCWSSWFINEKK